jgi:hypothetical protein
MGLRKLVTLAQERNLFWIPCITQFGQQFQPMTHRFSVLLLDGREMSRAIPR